MKRTVLATFCFLLLCLQAYAWQVRGVVRDPEGEPVAYANVYIQNTTKGVLTNIKGEYFFELENGSYTLVFSGFGFAPKTVKVEVANAHQVLDVELELNAVNIDTVTITAGRRDPAYEIMEQVIENKRRYQHQFSTYIRETYLKASLEVDSTLYYKARGDTTEVDTLAGDSIVMDSLPVKVDTVPIHWGQKDKGHPDSVYRKLGAPKRNPNERQKLNFIESVSTTYYADPGQYKSVIHAYRDLSEKSGAGAASTVTLGEDGVDVSAYQTTVNNPYLFYLDPTDAEFNFYDNLISVLKLGDQPYISPLSSTAWRLTYKYRLVKTFEEEGRIIHQIEITPRNTEAPVFQGEIFVVDGLWAIKSVNLQVLKGNLNYFRDFRLVHDYKLTDDMRWILEREEYYYMVKDGKIRYYGNTIAMHKDYQLDVEHPKGMFRNELRHVEKEAFEQDSAYWATRRPITLKKAEVDFIRVQDSLHAYFTSAAYLGEMDSSYNRLTWLDFLVQGVGFRDRKRGMEYFFNPLIAQIRPLGVGGYRHAIGGEISKTFEHFHRLELEGEIDYGFANKDLKGQTRLAFVYNPKHFARAYVRYGDRYSMVTTTTSLVGLFGRNNWVRRIFYGVGHSIEAFNGLFVDFELDYSDRRAIDNLNLDGDLFVDIDDPRIFDPYKEFLITLRLRYTPFQKYYSEPYRKVIVGSKWPTFTFTYKKGLPGVFDSEINFDFIELRATDEFRPGTWGIGRWAIVAGSFLQENNLRFTDFKFFRGSTPYFFTNPLEDFQNLDSTYSTTGEYLQLNYHHDESGALLNKIPLLRRTPLMLSGGASMLLVPDRDLWHSEVYGGISFPFRLLKERFKLGAFYVASYSNSNNAIGSQIKFGLTFYDSVRNRWEY